MFEVIGQPPGYCDEVQRRILQKVMDYWENPNIDLEEKVGNFNHQMDVLREKNEAMEKKAAKPRNRR